MLLLAAVKVKSTVVTEGLGHPSYGGGDEEVVLVLEKDEEEDEMLLLGDKEENEAGTSNSHTGRDMCEAAALQTMSYANKSCFSIAQ